MLTTSRLLPVASTPWWFSPRRLRLPSRLHSPPTQQVRSSSLATAPPSPPAQQARSLSFFHLDAQVVIYLPPNEGCGRLGALTTVFRSGRTRAAKAKGKLDVAWGELIKKAVAGTASATPHPVALPIDLAHTVQCITCRLLFCLVCLVSTASKSINTFSILVATCLASWNSLVLFNMFHLICMALNNSNTNLLVVDVVVCCSQA